MRRTRSRPLAAFLLLALGAVVLAACLPPAPPPPPPTPTAAADPPTIADGSIMGPSQLTAAQIAAYVCHVGHCPATPATAQSWKPEITPTQMAQLYIDEGNLVGVRGDIAFCQSVLETGWFAWPSSPDPSTVPVPPPTDTTFPGYVLARDHNYAGIGAYTGSTVYMRQDTPQLGVRAQLQHLRNYADATSNANDLGAPFVPRPGYTADNFTAFVYHGKAPNWVDLDGRWAVPGTTYGQTILGICNNMRTYSGLAPIPVPAASGAGAQSELGPFDPSQVTFRS
ncbi:MAG TPA: glucosaminidase domain-containing protein [Acidimicrobiia bacterium]|nr:glucosaminidase domain-containing protein [Acidimicrobiia bacterium]